MARHQENSTTHLSDSAVKEKWKKDTHCHFCVRHVNARAELQQHLEDNLQSDCAACYFRHYKTKVNLNLVYLDYYY